MDYIAATADIEAIIKLLQQDGRWGWANKLAMDITAAKRHLDTLLKIKARAEGMMQSAGVQL